MLAWLKRTATGRTVLLLFGITVTVYLVMILGTIPVVEQHAGGRALFDLSPTGYSVEQARGLLGTLGEEGRMLYLLLQLPMDALYPGLFAVTYALMLAWLLARCLPSRPAALPLALLPFLAGLFDYLENICIAAMLIAFPALPSPLVTVASAFTVLKSVFSSLVFLLLLLGFGWLLLMWLARALRRG